MLIGFPSADVIPDATLTSADEDSEYPLTNAQNDDASDTAKFTGTSGTIDIDLDAPATLVALMVVNTNATSGSFVSDSGSILASLTFPARTPDSKLRNKMFDLRGLPNTTDDHFELTLSKGGAAQLEFGRIVAVTALQAPEVLWAGAGQSPTIGHRRFGFMQNETRLGSTPRRASPVAARRRMTLATLDEATLAIFQQLEAESLGLLTGFLFVPDDDTLTDAWFAQCEVADFEWTWDQPGVFPLRLTIHEIAMGLPPGPD